MTKDNKYYVYKDIVESWVDFITNVFKIKNKKELQYNVAELVKSVYNIGYKDACRDLKMERYEKEIRSSWNKRTI